MGKLKILFIFIIILLVLSIIFMFDILFSFILQSEKIGFYEMKLMLVAKYDKSQNLIESKDNLIIPLPIGTLKFKNKIYSYDNQYLVSNKNIRDFLDNRENILDEYDLVCEQMGSSIIIKNKQDSEKYISINIHQYTSNFMRLIVN